MYVTQAVFEKINVINQCDHQATTQGLLKKHIMHAVIIKVIIIYFPGRLCYRRNIAYHDGFES